MESSKAFINAAKKSGRAGDIQPGVFRVPLHASGSSAMAAILNPANKLITQITIPEGYTESQVLTTLATKTRLPAAELKAAAGNIRQTRAAGRLQADHGRGFPVPVDLPVQPG